MSMLGSVLALIGVAAAFHPKAAPEVEKELVDAKLTIGRLEVDNARLTDELAAARAERDRLLAYDFATLQAEHHGLQESFDYMSRMHDQAVHRLAMYEGMQAQQLAQYQQAQLGQAQLGQAPLSQYQQALDQQLLAQQPFANPLGAVGRRRCTCSPARHDMLLGRIDQ